MMILTLVVSIDCYVFADTTDAQAFGLSVGNKIQYSGISSQVWERSVVKDSTDIDGNIYYWRVPNGTGTLNEPNFKVGINHIIYENRGNGLTSALYKLDAEIGEGWLVDSAKGELSNYMVRQPDIGVDPQWGTQPRRLVYMYKNRGTVETAGPTEAFVYVPQIGLILEQDYVFGTTYYRLLGARINGTEFGVLTSMPAEPIESREPKFTVKQVANGLLINCFCSEIASHRAVGAIEVFDLLGQSLASIELEKGDNCIDTFVQLTTGRVAYSGISVVVFYDEEHTVQFSTTFLWRSL